MALGPIQQNLAEYYDAVIPVTAVQTFRPRRNSNDGELTAGALLVVPGTVDDAGAFVPSGGAGAPSTTTVLVDGAGDPIGTTGNPLFVTSPPSGPTTAAVTSIAASATSVQAIAANPARVGLLMTNTGTAGNALIIYGNGPATLALYSVKIFSGQTWAFPHNFRGAVQVIWDTITGAGPLTVTEETA